MSRRFAFTDPMVCDHDTKHHATRHNAMHISPAVLEDIRRMLVQGVTPCISKLTIRSLVISRPFFHQSSNDIALPSLSTLSACILPSATQKRMQTVKHSLIMARPHVMNDAPGEF